MQTKQYSHDNIILFDGICNFCSGIVQFIIKKDKKAIFKFAALQSDTGKQLLSDHHLPIDALDTFVYIRSGKPQTRSTAGLYVLKDLGGFWKIFFAFIIFPKFLRDFLYNLIAKSRYRLWGKKESCMIPTQDISQRFLN